MAMRPLRACPVPGCREIVVSGRCEKHRKEIDIPRARRQSERQGTPASRGYDHRWRAYSKSFLAKHPICADPLGLHGELGAMSEVTDHIVPEWAGGKFWDHANHQALCRACNRRKALQDARKYGPEVG